MKPHQATALSAVLFSFSVHALQPIPDNGIETIVVSASNIKYKDVDAPYTSEVYTAEQIAQSSSANLYDFLDKQTSITILPSFGNRFSQLIDIRGYGVGDGYQNLVVNLDGRRLNNIDGSPQLLGAIPLESIERIEIVKGSGSVMHGDGAMAGVISIHTKSKTGASFSLSGGNHGVFNLLGQGGFNSELLGLSIYVDQFQQGGFSEPDIFGAKDEADKTSLMAKMSIRPSERLTLDISLGSTDYDITYPGALTLAEFKTNPAQNSGNMYNSQTFEENNWGIGATLDLSDSATLKWEHSQADKQSIIWLINDYAYRENRLTLNYSEGAFAFVAGGSFFEGDRISSTNTTSKENRAAFLQADYLLGDTLLSAGLRKEEVEYRYAPVVGASLKGDHQLTAWDFGLNHRVDDQISLFANYNHGYQAPDIDRFFVWGGGFNGFIEPAKSKTLNIGINYLGDRDKLKLTAFHSAINNEIYYFNSGNFLTSFNTNIDKSHKYGLELQADHRFNEALTGHLNYTYTQAIIDREDHGTGTYNGKNLPGVSPHAFSLGINWKIGPASHLSLNHTYRDEAYAAEDFANNFSQNQEVYHSTDLGYHYRVHDQVTLFANVQNLFEQSNGIWIRDDVIYPVNFTRNWNLGIKVDL